MVVKLVGSPISTCTKRAALALLEKKVEFEFVPIDLAKAEHKAASFVEKQPFGQVPYLDDDGFIVYESRAIARYVAEKWANQGTPLIPFNDIKKKALFEQAVSVETSNFDAHASTAIFEKLFKPFFGLPADIPAFEVQIKKLEGKLDAYDKILAKQKYLAGNELTLADLFHLPYGSLLPVAESTVIQDRPNVARWWNDISSRESWLTIKDGIKVPPVVAPSAPPAPKTASGGEKTAVAVPAPKPKPAAAESVLPAPTSNLPTAINENMSKTERDRAYLAAAKAAAANQQVEGGPWKKTKAWIKVQTKTTRNWF